MDSPSSSKLPTVAIVGRPNVGKSTLFNRIVGKRIAIVEEKPGVTRDRKERETDWQGRPFLLVDTGGWTPGGTTLDEKVSQQSERAMADADVVVMVVDAITGLTDDDDRFAEVLRKLDVPRVLMVNKVDSVEREHTIWEFLGLGLGEPMPVSALHGVATGDFLDHLVTLMPPEEDESEEPLPVDGGNFLPGVAIVGRPNVGKSTLFNRMIGDERSVVHDMAGTTRDSIDTIVETDTGPIKFIDTAGMRRRARIDEATEYYSMVRALQSVDEADVALLVIDANDGITHQDQRLAERVDAAGSPIVVLLNKWETLSTEAKEEVTYQVETRLHFLGDSPILRVSALTGSGIQRLLPAINDSIRVYHTRIPTRKVNQVIQLAQSAQPAPHGGRILNATQGAIDPPTFTLFANKDIAPAYIRYLERRLREDFELGNTPIKMRVRRRG
ncbi:MAG: ribosome biogenesis GTPase Der [Actinobacteria bacterium]|nr:ribosome biogenesis GTPase Der [Actinomycetota bacterium]